MKIPRLFFEGVFSALCRVKYRFGFEERKNGSVMWFVFCSVNQCLIRIYPVANGFKWT